MYDEIYLLNKTLPNSRLQSSLLKIYLVAILIGYYISLQTMLKVSIINAFSIFEGVAKSSCNSTAVGSASTVSIPPLQELRST